MTFAGVAVPIGAAALVAVGWLLASPFRGGRGQEEHLQGLAGVVACGPVLPMRALALLRLSYAGVVTGTVAWSWSGLRGLRLCDEAGVRCVPFAGLAQLSTFTRWSWLLEGAAFLAASLAGLAWGAGSRDRPGLARLLRTMLSVSLANALLVTVVVYFVLVPSIYFREVPPGKRDSVALLLSPQGHIMHSLNSVFILVDFRLTGLRTVWSDFAWAILFSCSYIVFEWVFYHKTGIFHYPFLDYTRPRAEASYVALLAAYGLFWWLSVRLTSSWAAGSAAKVAPPKPQRWRQ